jgi:glycosyltransferase involved in cell wall biosynthesis
MLPEGTPNDNLEFIDQNVKLNLFKATMPYSCTFNPTRIFMVYNIAKYIKEFNPDIVHVHGAVFSIYLIHILLGKFNLSIVTTLHDVKPHIGEESLLHKFVMLCARKYSNHIFVHGKRLKEVALEEFCIPSSKVSVIPIGEHAVAPFKKYEKNDLKEDGNLILFFGRIWEYKGLKYLIKAEPMITEQMPDAKIIIAGAGEDFKKYENMMVNRDNFIVRNYRIPYKEGAELFQRCSVIVLPYIDASQSGVIPTAYGFKKAIVVTNVGSIPEIVDDGVTGFIVPPKDPVALAEAIIKLLKDEKLRREIGENAYKKLKRDLSWDKIAEKTIEVYKEAINEHENKRWKR